MFRTHVFQISNTPSAAKLVCLIWVKRYSFGGPYFLDWSLDFTDWTGLDLIVFGMETGTCHGIVDALDYIKDENNVLLDILFDYLVFI